MITVRRALLALGLAVTLAPGAAPATPTTLFGTAEFRATSLAGLPQWERALARIEDERVRYDACRRDAGACPLRSLRAWQLMIHRQHGRPPIEQLRAVNQFLNQWRYRPDVENYGRSDYWASPLEFLRRSGDCEDYAIIKYVSLRQLGFPADRLRVVVVRDVVREIAHAVLAVYLDDDVYILDNLSRAVLAQAEVTRYVPYYSINERSRWAHISPSNTLVSQDAERPTPSSPQARQ